MTLHKQLSSLSFWGRLYTATSESMWTEATELRSYCSNLRNVNAALTKNMALSSLSQTGLLPSLLDETTQAVVVPSPPCHSFPLKSSPRPPAETMRRKQNVAADLTLFHPKVLNYCYKRQLEMLKMLHLLAPSPSGIWNALRSSLHPGDCLPVCTRTRLTWPGTPTDCWKSCQRHTENPKSINNKWKKIRSHFLTRYQTLQTQVGWKTNASQCHGIISCNREKMKGAWGGTSQNGGHLP